MKATTLFTKEFIELIKRVCKAVKGKVVKIEDEPSQD